MPKPIKYGKRERLSFGKIPEIMDLPDLIEVQKSSYEEFLQRSAPPEERKDKGLQAVFNEIFPIPDFSETSELQFVSYSLGAPKYDINECQARGFSYALPVKVRVQLVLRQRDEDTGENQLIDIKENEVYMGEIPLMTENGTFIINGSERVIVSQLQRSPGATFGEEVHNSGQPLNTARIIPYRGAWIEFEYDIKDLIYVRLDRRKKMLVTILLRALGWETDETILKLYAKTECVKLDASLIDRVTADPIKDPATGDVLLEANTELTAEQIDELLEAGINEVEVLDADDAEEIRFLRNTLNRDLQSDYNLPLSFQVSSDFQSDLIDGAPVSDAWYQHFKDNGASLSASATVQVLAEGRYRISNKNSRDNFTIEKARDTLNVYRGSIQDLAVVEIFRKLQPGDPPTIESAYNRFEKLFFDPVRYDLADVGRYKLNEKLGNLSLYRNENEVVDEQIHVLRAADIAAVLQYLLQVQNGNGEIDDIDHLGNRRVRAVGELLQNQVRMGMLRVTRATRERLTVQDLENVTPADLINPKPLTAAIKDFFGSSQLSQFMQQANPLDELTHKRRLSALGPGGLHRERATFEVRDVHRTHYGRVCPVETPEGPSVGLIVSLSTYARVNAYGFMETPYRKVSDGKATDQIDYLAADKEDTFIIAQAHTVLDDDGTMADGLMVTRQKDDYPRKLAPDIDYIDVSPKQIVGVSAALIPFLEHDDANRALMGSNMQRQAVPLIRPEAPLIGTGLEHKAARDSGAVVLAKRDGVVESVSAAEIIIRTDDAFRIADGEQSFSEMGYDVYRLTTFKRSNSGTSLHQRPCVNVGEQIKAGQVIADGTSTENGELALGSNILIAFMSWEGYNYEDAILLNESLITDDTYTSIHIEEFEVEARDTKMGREEITRDIPNVAEEALAQLDEEGIIRIGSIVRPGSILVGKVTPKGESDLGPEEKLLRAIFGEKVGEVRDASKYVKPGTEGVVVDVKVFSRKERERDRQTELREIAKEKEVDKEWQAKCALINQRKNAEIRNALLGKKLASSVSDGTNLIARRGRIVTEEAAGCGCPVGTFSCYRY